MLFHCWSSAVGGGPILKQHWVKSSRLLGSTQVSVYTHPSATIIFSPADQGTFSKTARQSQAYYNTWNWERGTYDVNHLHILTCEGAVSRVSSVVLYGIGDEITLNSGIITITRVNGDYPVACSVDLRGEPDEGTFINIERNQIHLNGNVVPSIFIIRSGYGDHSRVETWTAFVEVDSNDLVGCGQGDQQVGNCVSWWNPSTSAVITEVIHTCFVGRIAGSLFVGREEDAIW